MILGTQFFLPAKKNVKKESVKSHRLMQKAGMIEQIGYGLYFFTPLGLRILKKVEAIVDKWHQRMGFSPCLAPNLQPAELWHESGREEAYGEETMRLTDRHSRQLILGPTAEEVFTKVAKNYLASEKDLPLLLHNIQWKYRDEIRPRFGLVRCREFLMCDGYSFHKNEKDSLNFYETAYQGYLQMFAEIGLDTIPIKQEDTGAIGGPLSHEFFVEAEEAEDSITFDRDGQVIKSRGIEIGHIYYLDSKYSEPMGLKLDKNPIKMGCYGVGVTRIVAALVEVYGREEGSGAIFLPPNVTPFNMHIVAQDEFRDLAEEIHNIDPENIYYDDSARRMGEKFALADLIGAPVRIVIGQRFKNEGNIEVIGSIPNVYKAQIDSIIVANRREV